MLLIVSTNECDVELMVRLVRRFRILLVGASEQGAYVGPLVTTADQCRSFGDRPHWAFETRLDDLGVTRRPTGMVDAIRAAPAAVARAVRAAVQDSDSAVTVSDGRLHQFPTADTLSRSSPQQLLERQSWTWGALRNARLDVGSIPGTYVASCRTPAAGVEHLEGNSGKGVSIAEARISMVGEAVERSAALLVNQTCRPLRRADTGTRVYDVADFHPYGSRWTDASSSDRNSRVERATHVPGVVLGTGESVLVPVDVVAAPVTAAVPTTSGVTTGLAAHTSWEDAVLRGLNEVLERDSFYRGFMWRRPAVRVDINRVVERLGIDLGARELWAIRWEDCPVQSVHSFIYDPQHDSFSRGSGSGPTVADATCGSVIEASQIHLQMVRTMTHGAPYRWAGQRVTDAIRSYLDAQPVGRSSEPDAATSDSAGAQLTRITRRIQERGMEVIVVDLPINGPAWYAVRVLVPGATIAPEPAEYGGGRALLGAPWTDGIVV
ncbi:YcaO-like family protein [Nocardioides zeae]|uniref:YcaO-like family protein n=1 Tax=Nocardioides zeae TaxID=1457234 RepID=A0A6P0HMD5_9ACTN|nr:YcaO-like family protein [Nocardioides zeae]NEN79783.1 YcaO-like family protein [Nocardioides zeae]